MTRIDANDRLKVGANRSDKAQPNRNGLNHGGTEIRGHGAISVRTQ